jgi:hypothetical protein
VSCLAATPSRSAAACQRLTGSAGAATGAVSARNRSTAATTAAASPADRAVETISIRGLGGLRLPFALTGSQ